MGDTIQILVRNAAQSNFSMHPHGVFYNKTSEGAAYADNSNLSTANHGFVAPGEAYTYRVSPAAWLFACDHFVMRGQPGVHWVEGMEFGKS